MGFGEQLKLLRDEHGLKQEDVAKIIGVSRATISDFERNHSMPGPDYLLALSKHFNISIDTLLGNTAYISNLSHIQILYNKLSSANKIRVLERMETLLDLQDE